MRKPKLLSLFVAALFAASMWAADPIGSVDGLTGKNGSFRIWGWALDPDAEDSYSVTIHVYVFDNATETDLGKAKKGINAGSASISRPDLASIGHGTMHGFDVNLSITDLNPGTYYVRAYALDKQGVNNPMLGYSAGGDVQAATIGSPYTVSYDANGGSGAPASQKKAQDVTLTLQGKGSLARTGYTADGWATSATGNKAYDFGGTYTANAGATLYAHWNVVNYTIGYTLNGGSVSGNPTSYTIETNTITLNNPTRDGYTFKGWTGSNGETPQTTVQIAKGSTGNKTYTANWAPITYNITYDLAGGAVASANPANYNVETATFTLVNPTRANYTFLGWTGSNGNTPQTTVTIAKGSMGNKTYTANWTINPTTEVTYHMPDSIADEIVDLNRPEAPVIDGFTFLRWEFIGAPLSDGIKLQAIYKSNSNNAPKKVTKGEFTLEQKGDANEYILK